MNKRAQFIYKIPGIIVSRTLHQVSPPSQYAGQEFYKLRLVFSDQPPKTLQVFKDKLKNPSIWEIIKQRQCFRQKYLFFCHNIRGYFHLLDWEELPAEESPEVTD